VELAITEFAHDAMDPIACGLALEAIVDDDYWSRAGGELLLRGASKARRPLVSDRTDRHRCAAPS
jgi:hypothetical protein